MIDWLTYRVQVASHDPLANGAVMKVAPGGEVEWTSTARMALAGSYDASVYARSLDSRTVELSGNPTKYFQGHNLWGSNDAFGLGTALAHDLQQPLRIHVQQIEQVSRVDIAGLLDLGTPARVQEVVRALGQAGTMRNRGRGNNADEGTVYWGKRSRRWALKIYDKRRELLSTKAAFDLPTTTAIASGKLRVELVLRGMELKEMGLKTLAQWSTVEPMRLLAEFLSTLELPDQAPRLDVAALPRHLRLPFMQWAQGDDLRELYPRPTFYRHRKQLLAFGVDVAVPPAEPMTHISELTDQLVGYRHLPDLRTLSFWEPSADDRSRLPTFEPGSLAVPA